MSNVGEFHGGEFDRFIDDTSTEKITENDLLTRFREDITTENVMKLSNGSRRKVRDFLDGHGALCGRGTGVPIQRQLLALLGQAHVTTASNPASAAPSHSTSQATGPGY